MLYSLISIGPATPYVDLAIAAILIGVNIYTCFKVTLSMKVIIPAILFIVGLLLSYLFSLTLVGNMIIIFAVFYCVYVSLLLTAPEKEIELRKNKKVSKKISTLTDNETDDLILKLDKAINALSSTQTGALITIERTDDLSSYMQKSGTKVNAPVTPELLETIFYKGTPLHDGATIIRGNTVASSAVFYQPTQRPLNGKYGSRHRAAIGISEVCDALTIIVSEETGKVSVTYKGELISIPVASFKEKFKEFYIASQK